MKRFYLLFAALCILGCDDDTEIIIQDDNDNAQEMDDDVDNSTDKTANPDKKDPSKFSSDAVDDDDKDSSSGVVDDDDKESSSASESGDDTGENDENQNPENIKDACDNLCEVNEQCLDGQCLPVCLDPLVLCGTECVSLSDLHLENCTSCAADYCDSDNNLANGCEISLLDNDIYHCGSCSNVCQSDEICSEGSCIKKCDETQILCDDTCINASELHLKSCNECADYYCDDDGNLLNGCEIDALSNDISHCGTCENACNPGDTCDKGVCSHRYYVMSNPTPVVSGSGNSLGKLKQYTKVNVVEKDNDKYRIIHPEFEGQDASKLMDAGDQYDARKAIDFAEIYLYDADKKLCTYDFKTHEPILPYLANVYSDYNNHCANFVTSVLQNVELISKHENGANSLAKYCAAGNDGYRTLSSISEAKAGDVWVNNGHAELVVGYYETSKKLLLIGSNNASSGIYSIAHNTYGCNGGEDPGKKNACENGERDCSKNQRVTYSPLHSDGKVYSRQ